MKTTFSTGILFLMLTIILTGCAGRQNSATTYATGGTLLGAAVGALTAKNKVTGALIGAGAGMLLGYVVGNEMDKADYDRVSQTLETAPSGRSTSWYNPDSGRSYEATPYPAYVENDRIYRDIEIQSRINGNMETVHAKAYRDNDGTWQLVQ